MTKKIFKTLLFLAMAFVVVFVFDLVRRIGDSKEEIICAKNGSTTTFLLQHGLNGVPKEWDVFAEEIKKANGDYGIWRTQVGKISHISTRAKKLASFMKRAKEKCGTENHSVVAIVHSMGGLDLRYIIHHDDIAGLVRKVYTIATPHLGDSTACMVPGGTNDLCGYPDDPDRSSPMKDFNKKYPFSDFADKGIELLALRYESPKKKIGEDGQVPVISQEWQGSGADYEDRGLGWHKTRHKRYGCWVVYCDERYGAEPELCQTDEINYIISLEEKRQR